MLRQRLAAHEHPDASPTRCARCRARAPFAPATTCGAIAAPTVVVADRDEPDPGHPLRRRRAYARAIPGARLVVEDEGRAPIAWQGGQLSKVIAEVADEALRAS